MAEVIFDNINKFFGDLHIVKDFNLKVEEGEFIVLLGGSGCGKSTTLRMLAGLETITSGDMHIGGRRVNDLEPKERNIAMVFQSYALYPHMSVYQNIAFGLKLSGMEKQDIEQKVKWAAEMLQIEHLLDRKPKALSGGQRQRVAIGRAMVRTPDVFLFDEPLSNLDTKLRNQMRTEIKQLHSKLRKTTLYVTHDQVEAMTLADRIVIMNQGTIEQVGTPQDIYDKPKNTFVAGFIGSPAMNMIECGLQSEGENWQLTVGQQKVALPKSSVALPESSPSQIVLGIRPGNMHLRPEAVTHQDVLSLKADINTTELLGPTIQITGKVGEQKLTAEVPSKEKPTENTSVDMFVDCRALHFFDQKSGASLV